MKQMSFGAALAVAFGIAAISAAQQPPATGSAPVAGDDKQVTITGCVVKGDDGGFLLTSAPAQPAATPTGTAGEAAAPAVARSQVLYWLDDEDELEGMSGHTVEVTGELEGDVEKGEIEIEREGNLVKLEVKSDGKKVKASLPQVPSAVGTTGADDSERELDYIVRKIDVKSVKMIAPSCQ